MASAAVRWKLGVEVELLAPPGRSREDLAQALATAHGGHVRRVFLPQGEPSKVPGTPVFENLTLGFLVEDGRGGWLAKCVDDLTLQDDLDRTRAPLPGWYRVVSDDSRLLRLVMRHADPEAPLEQVLDPVAKIFGTAPQTGEGGMVRVADLAGAPIALAAPLPGERERPCELVSPPLETGHLAHLEALLGPARELGFSIPKEAATHLHFDAASLCDATTVTNLVHVLARFAPDLKQRFGSNPRCRRLGEWPPALLELVDDPAFATLPWPEAQAKLASLKLSKYCDFNLRNFVHGAPGKNTFEVRILPGWIEAEPIVEAAAQFAQILRWAQGNGTVRVVPAALDEVFAD